MNERLPRLETGDEKIDAGLDKFVSLIEKALNITTDPATPLRSRADSIGTKLWLDLPDCPWVVLSGSGPIYTGIELFDKPNGTWGVLSGGRTFTNIREASGATGLGGKNVQLSQSSINGWRFMYPRSCVGKICITTTSCSGNFQVPATVTVIDPHGNTLGPYTTSLVGTKYQYCIPITQSGTYSISATGPCGTATTTISATCAENDITIDVPSGTVTFTNLPSPCGQYASGKITLVGPNGYSSGPAPFGPLFFTNTIIWCVPSPGTYTAIFSDVGCNDPVPNQTVNVGSGCTASFSLTQSGAYGSFVVHVINICNSSPLPGASITATGPGGFSFSGTSDGSGNVTIPNVPPNCTISITGNYSGCAGYVATTISSGVACNGVTSVRLMINLDPSYNCCSGYSLANTLTLTGPAGSFTVIPDPLAGACYWYGCLAIPGVTYYDDCSGNPGSGPHTGTVNVFVVINIGPGSAAMSMFYRFCYNPPVGPLTLASGCSLSTGVTPQTNVGTVGGRASSVSYCPANLVWSVSGSTISQLNGIWTLTQ